MPGALTGAALFAFRQKMVMSNNSSVGLAAGRQSKDGNSEWEREGANLLNGFSLCFSSTTTAGRIIINNSISAVCRRLTCLSTRQDVSPFLILFCCSLKSAHGELQCASISSSSFSCSCRQALTAACFAHHSVCFV